jgi:branched-chain amino acid aminotransferase
MGLNKQKYLCHNGTFVNADKPILHHSNRGLRYGDAVFESIRTIANQPLFFDAHFNRLSSAMKLLKFEPPAGFTIDYLLSLTNKLLTRNRIFKGGRLRLTVFRDSRGNYAPTSNNVSFIIESVPIEDEFFTLNKHGKHLGIYPEDKISVNRFSNFKHANSLTYVMAGLFAREHQYDECFLLNENGHLCEAISSNFFVYKKNALFTPSLKEGCVDGIMRQQVINVAKKNNIPVFDNLPLLQPDIVDADELFTTNAIKGIQWILSYRDKRYYHTMATKLTGFLNQEVRKMI